MTKPIGTKSGSRISVALCTYNGGLYLREQLSSVAQQTRRPAELVVCDDQSTDDTVAILEEFASSAPFPVRVIVNSQRLGSTRNFDQAIGLASGEWIALCDQDDRWAPDKLERLSDVLIKNPSADGIFSDAELIDENSKSIGLTLFAKHRFTARKQGQFLKSPTAMLLKHDVVTGSTLMFRSSIRSYSLPIPKSWVHDGWLAWMIASHSRLILTTETLTAYRVHSGQQLGVGILGDGSGSELKDETRRQHYARVARQFEDLLKKLIAEGGTGNDDLVREIREKIAFLSRQSKLSPSLAVRVLQMIRLLPQYVQYARGLGSLRKDLMLGGDMS
jgi:glycosyltransferase involved in cell wall biosynthesis